MGIKVLKWESKKPPEVVEVDENDQLSDLQKTAGCDTLEWLATAREGVQIAFDENATMKDPLPETNLQPNTGKNKILRSFNTLGTRPQAWTLLGTVIAMKYDKRGELVSLDDADVEWLKTQVP